MSRRGRFVKYMKRAHRRRDRLNAALSSISVALGGQSVSFATETQARKAWRNVTPSVPPPNAPREWAGWDTSARRAYLLSLIPVRAHESAEVRPNG